MEHIARASEMIAETRAKLIAAGPRGIRHDRLCGRARWTISPRRAGLTRGALYHHFGDKKGPVAGGGASRSTPR